MSEFIDQNQPLANNEFTTYVGVPEQRMPQPVLSVLIPACDYVEGVKRILDTANAPYDQIEFIVHDDSRTSIIEKVVGQQNFDISYQRNTPPLGAPKNWNSLLNAANGQYVMLIHHDEYPTEPDFFDKLVKILNQKDGALSDVFVLRLRMQLGRRAIEIKLIPDTLRFYLLVRWKLYLLRRNFVGPTATLVIRRAVAPRFDPSLVWLVDVDYYITLLAPSNSVRHLRSLSITSEADRAGSITRSISEDLEAIKRKETEQLERKFGVDSGSTLVSAVDALFWYMARLLGLLWSRGTYSWHGIQFLAARKW